MKVLVTDGSSKASLGIVRSLGSKGIRVAVLSTSSRDLASRSRYTHASYIVPSPENGSFVEAVLDILGKERYDLIIPQGQAATLALARHKAEVASLAGLEVAEYDKVQSAADKPYVYELAAAVAVPVPRTVYPTCLEEMSKWASEVSYPTVIKQARQMEDSGVFPQYACTCEDLPGAYREFSNQRGWIEGNVLLQEFIPGYGCGFFALYQNGVCKRVFMHRRIRENPPSGKVSSCAESFYDAKLRDHGIRLLNCLAWHGVAMVEFRYDLRDGTYKLMEINPRFWGSLDLALAAGVDFPNYLCQMAQGRTLEYSEDYKRNLRYHWPLSEEMEHVWKRPRSFAAVLGDLLNPWVKSNLWLCDPRPNLYEGLELARSLMHKASKT